jgi:putative membrane protein
MNSPILGRAYMASVLISYSIISFYMLLTGRLSYYLHSRFAIFLYFAGFTTLAMGFFLILKKTQYCDVKMSVALLIFLLPIISFFYFSPDAVQQNMLMVRGVQITSSDTIFGEALIIDGESLIMPHALPNSSIDVSDSGFKDFIDSLYADYRTYSGRGVNISGVLYRRESFGERQAVLGRPYVWCCLADARLVGVTVYSDSMPEHDGLEWVNIAGTIALGETQKGTIPFIYAQNITPTKQTTTAFIFP